MITDTTDADPASDAGTLTALRAIAVEPSQPLTDLLRAADQQAALLRTLLPSSPGDILEHFTHLMPGSVLIEYIDTMPVPGISFWGNTTWHIHIRVSDPVEVQASAALHELKHIIDHPLRRQQPDSFSDSDWETLADQFAARVLARKPRLAAAFGERGDTDD